MLPDSAPPGQDPLEQQAPQHHADDPALPRWFLTAEERGNPASDLRAFTTGNQVEPLVNGATYFARLCDTLSRTTSGDQVYLLEFRGDKDERLAGPGTEVGRILSAAAERGVAGVRAALAVPPEAVG